MLMTTVNNLKDRVEDLEETTRTIDKLLETLESFDERLRRLEDLHTDQFKC